MISRRRWRYAPFDLDARAGSNATNEQAVLMLRALLTERFGLKAHPETRQLPVYSLVRASATSLGPTHQIIWSEVRTAHAPAR